MGDPAIGKGHNGTGSAHALTGESAALAGAALRYVGGNHALTSIASRLTMGARSPAAAASAGAVKSGAKAAAPAVRIELFPRDPEARAFYPSRYSLSGAIEATAFLTGAPPGATFQWVAPQQTLRGSERAVVRMPIALFRRPTSSATGITGLVPGVHDVEFRVSVAGKTIGRKGLSLSIPQFVSVSTDGAGPDALFEYYGIRRYKVPFMELVLKIARQLLARANVRIVWVDSPSRQQVPEVIAGSQLVVTAKFVGISGGAEGRALGDTGRGRTSPSLNDFGEEIALRLPSQDPSDSVGLDTRILVHLMKRSNEFSDAHRAMSRLIGYSFAHEIGHAVLADLVLGPAGHNPKPILADIMNISTTYENVGVKVVRDQGRSRVALAPEDAIYRFTEVNQKLLDEFVPVPPATF